jgi:hypothetical protein
MAKIKKELKVSLSDFDTENLIPDLSNPEDDEQEESVIEGEQEEVVEPIQKVKKPVVPVKKVVKQEEPAAEVEEEEELPVTETEEQHQEEGEQATEGSNFWEEVAKITGTEVEVDYGGVDPISPQGAALREQAVAEKAISDFVSRLQDEFPAVYQALEYAYAGGDPRELYQTEKDYTKVQIAEGDEDHAKALLNEYYQRKGFNESRAKRMIAADAESDEGLVGTAQAALTEMQQEQEEERQETLARQQLAAKKQKEQDVKFLSSVDSLISSGTLGTFRIPKAEAQEFSKFVRGSLQRNGDQGYLLVTPIDQAQLEKQLQVEYFKFKKGDLSKLIQVKATTQATENLKLRLTQGQEKIKSTTTAPRVTGSMKDLEV